MASAQAAGALQGGLPQEQIQPGGGHRNDIPLDDIPLGDRGGFCHGSGRGIFGAISVEIRGIGGV